MHPNPVTALPPIRLLCVEDNPDDVELMGIALERADPHRRYELHRVDDARGFVEALERSFDVILCDFNMPRFSPYAALQILVARKSDTPLVVVTRAIGEEAAVHVLRCGAKDYLTKDKLGTLPQIISRVISERHRALEQVRLSRELEQAYERLKVLSARLVMAQERERSIISRELHDQLGQTLTGMVIHLHAAQRAGAAEAAKVHTDTAIQMAHGAVSQLKTLSFALRPAQLDILGLRAATETAVQRMADPAGIAVEIDVRGVEPPPAQLDERASVALRLVQEALTNVVRHAQASLVRVRLRFGPGQGIGIVVADNGVGFDAPAVLGSQPCERNVGLYGMIERTELAGGRFRLRGSPGRGVVIRAML